VIDLGKRQHRVTAQVRSFKGKSLSTTKSNFFKSSNLPYNLPTSLKFQYLPISNTTKPSLPTVETLHSFLCSVILFHSLHLILFSQGRAHHNIPLNILQPSKNFSRGQFLIKTSSSALFGPYTALFGLGYIFRPRYNRSPTQVAVSFNTRFRPEGDPQAVEGIEERRLVTIHLGGGD